MKKTKILVPALAVLALGMAASVTGTVAWFAANNVVNANGMKIQSSTPSSLAIGKQILSTGIGDATVIDYETEAGTNILNPASHFHGSEAADGSLYKVSNGNDINPATGLAMAYDSGNGLGADAHNNNNISEEEPDGFRDLTYVDATVSEHNYVDYTCYLASVGQGITIGTNGYLRATINWGTRNQTTNAATVDFWVNTAASTSNTGIGTYMGTLNAAGVLASAGHAGKPLASYTATTAAGEDVTYVTLMENGNIPVNTSTNAIRVTMRVYLDGALLETKDKAYVTTNDVSTDGIDIAAVFTLERGQQA
jgi:hypothetical protein